MKSLLGTLTSQNCVCDLLAQVYMSEMPTAFSVIRNSVFSCSHMIHTACFDKLLHTVGNAAMQKQGTFFCPVCRRLGSFVFPLFFPVKVDCQWRGQLGDALLFHPDAADDHSLAAIYAQESGAMDHYILVALDRRDDR